MENKNGCNWKALALTLLVIVIIETAFLFFIWNLGTEIIEQEDQCALEICDLYGDSKGYDAYYISEDICYCYVDGEVSHQEYIG